VFVAASDRQVGFGGVDVDRQGAGAVTEVPERQSAVSVGQSGHLGHRPALGRLIMYVGEHHRGGVVVDSVRQLGARGGDDADAVAEQTFEATENVEVGREVAGLG